VIPQHVTRHDGTPPSTPKEDGLFGLAAQIEDATALHDQWYWTDVAAGQ
jgi:hypothetical protein